MLEGIIGILIVKNILCLIGFSFIFIYNMMNINEKIIDIYAKIKNYYNEKMLLHAKEITKNYDFKQKVQKYIKNGFDMVSINKYIYNEIKELYKHNFDEFIIINNNNFISLQINDYINYSNYLYHLTNITKYDLDNDYNLISLNDIKNNDNKNNDIKNNDNKNTNTYKYCINKIQKVYKIVQSNINSYFLYNDEFIKYSVDDEQLNDQLVLFNDYIIDIQKIIINRYKCNGLINYDHNTIKSYFTKRNIVKQLNIDYNFSRYINPHYLISDKDIILSMVKYDGLYLANVDEKSKDDFDIVLESVKNNGLSLLYASNQCKNDETIVKFAIDNNPLSYQYASNRLKINFMFFAIKNCALNIQFININELSLDTISKLITINPNILMFIDVAIEIFNVAIAELFLLNENLDNYLLIIDYGVRYLHNVEYISIISYHINKIAKIIRKNNSINNAHILANIISILHYKYKMNYIVTILIEYCNDIFKKN